MSEKKEPCIMEQFISSLKLLENLDIEEVPDFINYAVMSQGLTKAVSGLCYYVADLLAGQPHNNATFKRMLRHAFDRHDTADPSNVINIYLSDSPGKKYIVDIQNFEDLPVVLAAVAHSNKENEELFFKMLSEFVKMSSDKDDMLNNILNNISAASNTKSNYTLSKNKKNS